MKIGYWAALIGSEIAWLSGSVAMKMLAGWWGLWIYIGGSIAYAVLVRLMARGMYR